MKKIIRGKMYNTETAKALANRSHSIPRNFDYVSETLYQKKTGEFFLYCEGGANTKYAMRGENEGWWTSGKKIIPMTELEVRSWMESYCDADEYIAVFGEPEE